MVRREWKLRRGGGGARAGDGGVGGRSVFLFSFLFVFLSSSCHRDHSSDQLHHSWNTSSEETIGIASAFSVFLCFVPEMTDYYYHY